jgi:hypothetical protein
MFSLDVVFSELLTLHIFATHRPGVFRDSPRRFAPGEEPLIFSLRLRVSVARLCNISELFEQAVPDPDGPDLYGSGKQHQDGLSPVGEKTDPGLEHKEASDDGNRPHPCGGSG